MSTATQTISLPIIVAKIRKFGYAGRDSIDDVKAWIEKRYDAVTVYGQSISLDELEQIGLKHVAEGIGADLDGDGVGDLAVGAVLDDDGGLDRGAVWVLFLDDGSCPWDLDDTGDVGIGDLLILLADWGNPYGVPELLDLLAAWGPCP